MTGAAAEAKQLVQQLNQTDGHQETTVDETVAPAVTHETIIPTREEQITTVVTKETHQDHYHTTVQPVQDFEVQPATHTNQTRDIKEYLFKHGDSEEVERRVARQAASYRNEQVEGEGRFTASNVTTVVREHIHHHMHELIQPVIQRQVIQPIVIHTTVPIHEVHRNHIENQLRKPLPAIPMRDFRDQGQEFSGRDSSISRKPVRNSFGTHETFERDRGSRVVAAKPQVADEEPIALIVKDVARSDSRIKRQSKEFAASTVMTNMA